MMASLLNGTTRIGQKDVWFAIDQGDSQTLIRCHGELNSRKTEDRIDVVITDSSNKKSITLNVPQVRHLPEPARTFFHGKVV